MGLAAGTRLGAYEVLAPIGAGGMGEVYRARDTRLGRDVALKVLPAAFAGDAERLARFDREARALAALNHPHIAQVYGLEQTGATPALAMELVEGEDLSQRLVGGAIPLDEALPIARQIAEALGAAHEAGIIHRDLKPANVKIRSDGVVKVLDFGLAKALEAQAAAPASVTRSPTITSPALVTGAGMLLGTAAYMSPEQVRGKPADKRADVWAFGCLLYEMLTGRRPFESDEVPDTLALVLRGEPDWGALPATTPSPIVALMRRCLEKDRQGRIGDIAAARFVLEDHALLAGAAGDRSAYVLRDAAQAEAQSAAAAVRGEMTRAMRRRTALAAGAGLVVGVAAGAAALVYTTRAPAPRVVRTSIGFRDAPASLNVNRVSITRDGSRTIYTDGQQLFVRALDRDEAVQLTSGGSGMGAQQPFVSPDGQWVGFRDTSFMKKVAITGGPAVTLAAIIGAPRGSTWGPDGTIVFASAGPPAGLQRVSADGGEVSVLTTPDRDRGEADHVWPEFLPGGRAVLFTILPTAGGLDASQIAVLDLDTGARSLLLRGGSHARYVPSGHLIYAAAGSMRAVAFDPRRRAVTGTPVPIPASVVVRPDGGLNADVADDGTLVYVSGDDFAGARLVFVDRQGREEALAAPSRSYFYPRLSPDGSRIVVQIRDDEQDLWVWDLGRATLTRLTFDPAIDSLPSWLPDGSAILFSSSRSGPPNLFVVAADGTGAPRPLVNSPNPQGVTGVLPDGRRALIYDQTPSGTRDVKMVTLTDTPRVESVLATAADERGATISPDGRWLAYESNSGGPYEVYVRPFPRVEQGLWQVSVGGGMQPVWTAGGRELIYRSADGNLVSVPVAAGATWKAGAPAAIIRADMYLTSAVTRSYDVTPDGTRFLLIKTDAARRSPTLHLVQNWTEELKRLAPAR